MIPIPSLSLALIGLVALATQTMVYADTRREFWRFASTFPRFVGTAAVLGSALRFCFIQNAVTAASLMLFVLLKLAVDVSIVKEVSGDTDPRTQLRRTAILQLGMLRPLFAARFLLSLAGGVFIPFAVASGAVARSFAWWSCLLCFGGEMAERYLFFTTVAPDKMPGQS
jgi:DMSO reductase anchor subunit